MQEVCVPTGLSAVAGKSILGIPCMSTDVFQRRPDAIVIRKTHSKAVLNVSSFVLCFLNSQLHKVQLPSYRAF